ncbi:MAG: hypothetical protein WBC91_17725 [Phototrophicaceae bacterium]
MPKRCTPNTASYIATALQNHPHVIHDTIYYSAAFYILRTIAINSGNIRNRYFR